MKTYPIGVFSKITKITVKALRLYHEKGILLPSNVDVQTGYRYYNEKLLERAFTIQSLKQLDFSLKQITMIMESFSEDYEMVTFLRSKASDISEKIEHYQNIKNQLDFLVNIQEKQSMKKYTEKIVMKQLPNIPIAGIRYKGQYSDIGIYFKRLYKMVGFQTGGKPGALYYDKEYRENDADIEAFIPVKKGFKPKEIDRKALKGGKAHCLIHIGSYETLNMSYKRMLDYVEENQIKIETPVREIYIKGPGMIFKGNPDKYVTEIQFLETD